MCRPAGCAPFFPLLLLFNAPLISLSVNSVYTHEIYSHSHTQILRWTLRALDRKSHGAVMKREGKKRKKKRKVKQGRRRAIYAMPSLTLLMLPGSRFFSARI